MQSFKDFKKDFNKLADFNPKMITDIIIVGERMRKTVLKAVFFIEKLGAKSEFLNELEKDELKMLLFMLKQEQK